MGSEIESDAKLKVHAVKRENIMIQREKINRLITKRLLEQNKFNKRISNLKSDSFFLHACLLVIIISESIKYTRQTLKERKFLV